MLRNVDVAFAAANLLNIGFTSLKALELSEEWRTITDSRSLKNILSSSASLDLHDRVEVEDSARLFVSFHYSSYAHLYREIALRSPERQVASLLGAQSAQHQRALSQLAIEARFNIRFIHSGTNMLKAVRQAIRDGCPVVLLADLPWSPRGAKPDISFETCIGRFQALSTVMKMVRLIDQHYVFVTARRLESTIILENLAHQDFGLAFEALADLIRQCPQEYERLHQLHRICLPNASDAGYLIQFCEQGQQYKLFTKGMRLFKARHNDLEPDQNPGVLHIHRASDSLIVADA